MLELVVSAADYKLGKEAGRRGGRGGGGDCVQTASEHEMFVHD